MCLLSLFMSVMENMQNSVLSSLLLNNCPLTQNLNIILNLRQECRNSLSSDQRNLPFLHLIVSRQSIQISHRGARRAYGMTTQEVTFFTKVIECFLINSNVFSDVNLNLLVAQCCYSIYHRDARCDLGERLPSGNSGRFKQPNHIKFCSPYTTMQGNRKQIGRGKPFM